MEEGRPLDAKRRGVGHERCNDFDPDRGGGDTHRPGRSLFRPGATTRDS
jgi:hypothetical protein